MSPSAYGVCPWLGSEDDRSLRFREPLQAHRCYAQVQPGEIPLEYQAQTCLSDTHRSCRFYLKPPPAAIPAPLSAAEDEVGPSQRQAPWPRVALWALVVVAALAVAILYGREILLPPVPASESPAPGPTQGAAILPTKQVAAVPVETVASAVRPPAATVTPHPGGAIAVVRPSAASAGWVASNEVGGNHLGDSYLHTGVFDGVIYHGIFQLDLSGLPRGAPIHAAALELTGLSRLRLGTGGTWQVRALAREEDADWDRKTFQDIHNADLAWTLLPTLVGSDLGEGRTNTFALAGSQLDDLERRLLDAHYALSLRIDGPLAGPNDVFAWDSGYAAESRGEGPRLILSLGPAPETPLPTATPEVVVVTSTPTPANVLTAEAEGSTATALARTRGTPTPTSAYQWTATPQVVVTSTPTPDGPVEATLTARWITAVAFTTGTFTPAPYPLVTATPTPVMIPWGELTPTPGPPQPSPRPDLPAGLRAWILFESSRAGIAGPWAMDSEGDQVGLLTARWPYEAAANREPFSPDGAQQAQGGRVGRQPALLVQPTAGGSRRAVVVFEEGTISEPAWSPTGNWIAFTASDEARSVLWVVRPDGTGLRQLTQAEAGSANHPTFSPDGTHLAFALTGTGGRRQVWSISVIGTGLRNLSNNGWDEWAPVWAK